MLPALMAPAHATSRAEPQTAASVPATSGAQGFIDDVAKRGIDFLANESASIEQKRKSFSALLHDSFDLPTIGRFALGPYWRVATSAERTEYQGLFEKLIIDVYSERFSSYNGQDFKTESAKSVSDTDSVVTSYIITTNGGEKVRVDWRVRKNGTAYKIVDVIVEGVSMGVTQRSDFASVINRGGGNVSVLIDYLKNPKR